MGDKSPKATHKQEAQKQVRVAAAKQKKADVETARQAASPKKP